MPPMHQNRVESLINTYRANPHLFNDDQLDELEEEPPNVFDDDGKGIGKYYEGQELALEGHEPEPEPEQAQAQGPSIQNDSVSFENLPDDLYENLLNEIVFVTYLLHSST